MARVHRGGARSYEEPGCAELLRGRIEGEQGVGHHHAEDPAGAGKAQRELEVRALELLFPREGRPETIG